MPRYPLGGSSYALSSLAAAAQESLNCYSEYIEDPNEKGKGKVIVRVIPGYQLAKALTVIDAAATPVRGVWSGGGRLFAVAGTKYMELSEAYALVGSVRTVLDDSAHSPVQFFGNGNQLLLISAGQAYCDNGNGPQVCRFQLNGVVTYATPAGVPTLTWTSGDKFTAEMQGLAIVVNGHTYLLKTFTSATSAILSTVLNTGAGNVTTDGHNVYWNNGDVFYPGLVGMLIEINGVNYTITEYATQYWVKIAEDAGLQAGVAYSSVLTNLVYSSAGGPLVTALTGAYLNSTFYVQRPPVVAAAISGATAANPCVITFNGHNLVTGDIVVFSGGTGNWAALNGIQFPVTVLSTSTFSIPVNSTAFGALAGTVTYLGPDYGRQVNFSGVLDGTFWAGLDFFQKEGGADYLRSILGDGEILLLLGTENSEGWQADPSTGRMVHIPGTNAAYGSVAQYGPVMMSGRAHFIGGDKNGGTVAYRVDSSTPTRISTHAEEEAWAQAGSSPTEAVSYPYLEDGHSFWVINFAGNINSWVYDETASKDLGSPQWHQRAKWDYAGVQFLPYRPWFHTFIAEWGGKHIVGDYLNGNLYEQSNAFFDANGDDIAWRKACPYIYNDGNNVYFGRTELELDAGEVTALTVAGATNANPCVITSVAHGLTTGNQISFVGATGNWTPLNATFTITRLTADTFSIVLNSTAFGALTGTPVSSPVISYDYSDNRGKTFSTPDKANTGAGGDYGARVVWPFPTGASRGRVPRFAGVGKSKVCLMTLLIESEQGNC